MTEKANKAPEQGAGKSIPFDSMVIIFVLVMTLSQYSLGAAFDKTGEQVSSGLPLSTLVLALGVLALVVQRRKLIAPAPSWAHVVFLCAVSIGLLGLSRWEMKAGLKEVIQIGEVFGLSWYLVACSKEESLKEVAKGMGLIGIVISILGIGRLYEATPFMLSEARWAGLQLATIPFIYFTFKDKPRLLSILLFVIAVINGLFLKNGGMLLGLLLIIPLCAWVLARQVKYIALGATAIMLLLSVALPGTKAWESLRPQFDETYRKRLFVEYSAALLTPRYYPAGGGAGQYKRTINVVKQYMDDEASPLENKIPADSNSQFLLTTVESGLPAALALVGLLAATVIANFKHEYSPNILSLTVGLAAIGLLGAGLYTTTLGRGLGIWLGVVLGLSTALSADSKHSPKEFFTRLAAPLGFFIITGGVMIGFNKGEENDEYVSKMNQRLRGSLTFAVPFETIKDEPELTLRVIKANGNADPADVISVRKEGEDFALVSGKLKQAVVADASGTKALVIPLNSGKGVGSAEYKISIPENGVYRAKVRVFWEDGCSNSLRFTCPGGKQIFASERFKEWHTLSSRKTFELPAGDHLVTVENTEDGIKLDYFEFIKVKEAE